MTTTVIDSPNSSPRPLAAGGNHNDGNGSPPARTTFHQDDNDLSGSEMIALLTVRLVQLHSINRKLKRQFEEE